MLFARCLIVFALAGAIAPSIGAAEPERPRLLVLVVFDQMRGDYLRRWQSLFVADGFARLQKDGAWFTNCHYPYGVTVTGAGHASMLTGCSPDKHGIVANDFYDVQAHSKCYCATSPMYQRVPPLSDKPKKTAEPARGGSPQLLLVPTFADALKAAYGDKARVIGLSLKDRSAILPVGSRADGAYWFDSADGNFITSSFYRDSLPAWVRDFNTRSDRVIDRWVCKEWDRLPDIDYLKNSGPDDSEGEAEGIVGPGGKFRQGVTFPHPFTAGGRRDKAYREAVAASPAGNELLFELVKEAIIHEKLGQHDATDLLTVSFSSNDLVGHQWGPDSQEVLDITLRSDRIMAEFLKLLDEKVGAGKYLLALTADHGICPLPEVSLKRHIDAKRIDLKELVSGARAYLSKTFGKADDTKETNWFDTDPIVPWFYLNHEAIEARGLQPADVAKSLADYVARQPGIARAFTRADLEGTFGPEDQDGQRMKKSYYARRCGDVTVLLKPYYLYRTTAFPKGTSHGTPYAYDTYVPLLVFGSNVRAGLRDDAITPQAAAAIFAQALGIKPPAAAEAPCPDGLFRK